MKYIHTCRCRDFYTWKLFTLLHKEKVGIGIYIYRFLKLFLLSLPPVVTSFARKYPIQHL